RTENWGTADEVAWVCTLDADALADFTPLVRLTDEVVKEMAGSGKMTTSDESGASGYILVLNVGAFTNAKLAVYYRASKGDGTERLKSKLPEFKKRGSLWDQLFLAMAEHRLGEKAEAKKRLAAVVQALKIVHAVDWQGRLELDLLRREAESLI